VAQREKMEHLHQEHSGDLGEATLTCCLEGSSLFQSHHFENRSPSADVINYHFRLKPELIIACQVN